MTEKRLRFVKRDPPEGREQLEWFHPTQWWDDTHRKNSDGEFVAVETCEDKDPNDYVDVSGDMHLHARQRRLRGLF